MILMKPYSLQIALTLATGLIASAQPPSRPPGDRMPPPPSPLIAALDGDRDGTLSGDEIAAAAEALSKLDTNSDGSLTRDELGPKPPVGKAGEPPAGPPPAGRERDNKRPAPPAIAALDSDHDGTISAAEIKAAPESLKALDKNGDGLISPEELHPKGPAPEGQPRPGGPRGDGEGRRPGPPPHPEKTDGRME
jgi:hypothetical protein